MKLLPLKNLFGMSNGDILKPEDLTLPEEILEQAAKCLKGHSCLKARKRDTCEVDYSVQDGVVFIREREMTPCFYYNCFGNSHFCACPVRKKIYFQYHI
jgi:hypothetical protein